MVIGTLVAGVGNYAYQLLGGRALGPDAFAPVGTLLTIHFLAFIVVLLPVEQLVIRALTIRGGLTRASSRTILLTVVATAVTAGGVAWIGRDRFFSGDGRYAAVAAFVVLTHALFVRGRGALAGHRRFRAYGEASGGASILRLLIAAGVVIARPDPLGVALALAIGPLVVLAWPSSLSIPRIPDQATAPTRFLATFIMAAAASQVLLLAGPLAAGALGASAAVISIVFVTFTLARAPLTFGYNLIARVLPPFTLLAEQGDDAELNRWAARLAAGGVLLAVPAGLAGWWLGPPIVAALFGEGFRPDPLFAALAAAGVSIAGASLFLGQVLVARGDTARLAVAWLVGVAGAGVGAILGRSDVTHRIGWAFLTGEISAIVAMTLLATKGLSRYEMTKRLFDLTVGSLLLTAASPILLLVTLAVRLDSKGPALFFQERVGKNGETFRMVKFRTMRVDAGEDLHHEHLSVLDTDADRLKMQHDPRITRVGALLRKASLDELPNLWNVVKGDMSLVGPRPLVPMEADLLADSRRSVAKPGVTGYAQVRGRDAISPEDRNRYDLEYLEVRSFWMDLRILFETIPAIVRDPGE